MTVRAAVVQMGSRAEGSPATVKALCEHVDKAASAGARLVVFPEALVGGYPKGQDFGAKVGIRTPEGRAQFRRYFENAVEIPSPEVEQIAEAAARNHVWVVAGIVERAGGTLYCTVLFFTPDGALAGKHRKVMPTAVERLIWGQGDGSTLTVLETELGSLGAVICWENYMPLLRYTMYAKGIELYCACTVDDRDSWVFTMRHIAIEGRCFVLSACQYVDGLIRGGSLIANPFGELIAGPAYGEETILLADLDMGQIAEGKFDLDVAGHYARPDIFSLTVDQGG